MKTQTTKKPVIYIVGKRVSLRSIKALESLGFKVIAIIK